MKDNPEKYARQIEELKKQLASSQKAYETMLEAREKDKLAFEQKKKEMIEEFEKQVKATGLTRKTLLNDQWHEKLFEMAIAFALN